MVPSEGRQRGQIASLSKCRSGWILALWCFCWLCYFSVCMIFTFLVFLFLDRIFFSPRGTLLYWTSSEITRWRRRTSTASYYLPQSLFRNSQTKTWLRAWTDSKPVWSSRCVCLCGCMRALQLKKSLHLHVISFTADASDAPSDSIQAEREREEWEREQQRAGAQPRSHRSVSRERWVETMVVADSKLIEYHGSEHVESYIFTIMNMVRALHSCWPSVQDKGSDL